MPAESVHELFSRSMYNLARAAYDFAGAHAEELIESAEECESTKAFVDALDEFERLIDEHEHQRHVDQEFNAMIQEENHG
jgi:hypothetical protein